MVLQGFCRLASLRAGGEGWFCVIFGGRFCAMLGVWTASRGFVFWFFGFGFWLYFRLCGLIAHAHVPSLSPPLKRIVHALSSVAVSLQKAKPWRTSKRRKKRNNVPIDAINCFIISSALDVDFVGMIRLNIFPAIYVQVIKTQDILRVCVH